MNCQKCESDRLISINVKTGDSESMEIHDYDFVGRIPDEIGITDGSYMEFTYCLNCGQIQGDQFPLPITEIERGIFDGEDYNEDEDREDYNKYEDREDYNKDDIIDLYEDEE